jgi:hypothetical protein
MYPRCLKSLVRTQRRFRDSAKAQAVLFVGDSLYNFHYYLLFNIMLEQLEYVLAPIPTLAMMESDSLSAAKFPDQALPTSTKPTKSTSNNLYKFMFG